MKQQRIDRNAIASTKSHRSEVVHLLTAQQNESLIPQTPLPPPTPILNPQLRRFRHLRIPLPQTPPVTRLRSGSEISLTESLDRIVGNPLRLGGIGEQVSHLVGQVGEVALDFDVVLRLAVGAEEVVVVLDVLQFVGDDDGVAGLAVFQRSGVGSAWVVLVCENHVIAMHLVVPSTCAMYWYLQWSSKVM